jgi:hypothetical protein
MKTILTLLIFAFPLAAITQSTPNIPTYTCKQYGGRYFTPSAGIWSGSFWYGSTLVDSRSANTKYNKFKSAYNNLRMHYRAKIASVYLMQALCVSAAESSYAWCLIPCSVSLRPNCGQDCWDDLGLDLDQCDENKDEEIRLARLECDRLLKGLLYEYGGCS